MLTFTVGEEPVTTSQKRDADMERLLRAVLKAAPQGTAGECPDADLLAAHLEGSLTAVEQATVDAHIAVCGRCQEILVVLSQGLTQDDEDAATSPSGWFTWVNRPRLRWLVPISAAATLAVVFFATRPLIAPERKGPAPEVVQMAQTPTQPAELPGAGAEVSREQSVAVPQKNQAAIAPERQEKAGTQAEKKPPSKVAADALAGVPPPGERERDKKPVEPVAETMAARVTSEEKRTPPAAQAAASPPAGGQLAVSQQAANKPAAGDAVRNLEAGFIMVSAPGGTVLWRFGAGGRLSRSGDSGETWHEQTSGVTADLLAASAPSPATCWIAGAAGTVLLTTDGERWERRQFPYQVDLVAVAASNAHTAVVTARDGRRFETLDAGLTWSPRQ